MVPSAWASMQNHSAARLFAGKALWKDSHCIEYDMEAGRVDWALFVPWDQLETQDVRDVRAQCGKQKF